MARSSDDSSDEERRRRKRKKRSRKDDDDDDESDEEEVKRKKSKKREYTSSSSDEDDDRRERKRKKSKKHRKSHKKKKKKRKKKKHYSSSSSSSDSSSSDDDGNDDEMVTVMKNKRLMAKLAARGETLEERKLRRSQKRAAYITTKFGYTAEDNPFNDPNLHETFTWKKRDAAVNKGGGNNTATSTTNELTTNNKNSNKTFEEIEKVRKRRKEREEQIEEMERIRAEESRMKELENYDDWARKEEEFHLQQQRQRSAIRLVEGREKPIDVLAKNILMFGLSDEEKQNRASVKYQERYNALEVIGDSLEAELEEPHNLLKMLKLEELEELLIDIDAFRKLEHEAASYGNNNNNNTGEGGTSTNDTILRYWDNLHIVTQDEIKFLKSGGKNGRHANMVTDVLKIFEGQSISELIQMKNEIDNKLRQHATDNTLFRDSSGQDFDRTYWIFVIEQLNVYMAKTELSNLHSKMLVRQLEHLEKKREELAKLTPEERNKKQQVESTIISNQPQEQKINNNNPSLPDNVEPGFGDLEEELGLAGEYQLGNNNTNKHYTWQEKYQPRKPRYFNRVKIGYDWNKYNQTHYDKDNPPPKIVQGYKFNIFYPDLIDQTKTPKYFLEPADTNEFCIIRFTAGPPYEDIAFKIVNREWNRSRKRGFKCTFERGVLSLYFNFTTYWYRR